MPTRDPGDLIKRQLRQEVNFGCPVRFPDGTGCGCPILVYHHFDPPWAGNFEHNPDGMIALCQPHHSQADGGGFSTLQLRDWKRNPFVDSPLRVRWPWLTDTLVMKIGRSLVIGSGSPIRLQGRPIMHFEPRPVEALGLNVISFDSHIVDKTGRPWLTIADSWFDLDLEQTTDLEFAPQLKKFQAVHDDHTSIRLRFRRYPLREFQAWMHQFMTKGETADSAATSLEGLGAVDADGYVPVMTVMGSFQTHEVKVVIRGHRMTFTSFIPGLEETFDWGSWVVDSEHRAILRTSGGTEFFSLG